MTIESISITNARCIDLLVAYKSLICFTLMKNNYKLKH